MSGGTTRDDAAEDGAGAAESPDGDLAEGGQNTEGRQAGRTGRP